MKTTHLVAATLLGALTTSAFAAPTITRINPPSALFTFGETTPPYIARFYAGQRFDLQATVVADAGKTISKVEFFLDGKPIVKEVELVTAAAGQPANSTIANIRAYSNALPGVHILKVTATQSDGLKVSSSGNFEVVKGAVAGVTGTAKNIIVMIGDGFGASHRTAARIMSRGVDMGKANALLAVDTFPTTGLVMTASLNSIITDSSPGAACYSTGNKANNNQQGVFPDDTTDAFDNPRVETIGELLARTASKNLGIVTTADVFDATPGAWGTHTSNRGAGTGICDQYLDEAVPKANLKVLLGGGRKWFLPGNVTVSHPTTGSARAAGSDYVLPAKLATAWGVTPGVSDPNRDLIADFQTAGFTYTPDKTTLAAIPNTTTKLLGLFALSNMNVALDKINGRRNPSASTVVSEFGFPDQPMLDEMTDKALQVLNTNNTNGFVLMIEGASIDKQAHNMDTERWILDVIEFDRAIAKAKAFAAANPNTIVLVTADHECAGAAIIGATTITNATLATRAATAGSGVAGLRDTAVGIYEAAGFPFYQMSADGYPVTTDVDKRMLIGYAGNADRYEDWLTNEKPLQDSQQRFISQAPLNSYPSGPLSRDVTGDFRVTGQVPGTSAVHTGGDIPISAYGFGSQIFTGVMDNTDVFFKLLNLTLK